MTAAAEAPGKIIILGEYAVFGGVTGYVVALRDYTTKVELSLSSGAATTAVSELLKKALDVTLPVALTSSASTIPQGAGLGSSAAFSVCLARCLATLQLIPESDIFPTAKRIDDYFHAGSSGMDVFACFSGGGCSYSAAYGFKRLESSKADSLRRFRYSLVDTGERRELRVQKKLLDQQKLTHFYPQAQRVVEMFEKALNTNSLNLSVMIECFNAYQDGLKGLGVSTPLIDCICSAVRSSGLAVGAKITGGGFGGHVLLVHDEFVALEAVQSLLPSGATLHWNVQLHEM